MLFYGVVVWFVVFLFVPWESRKEVASACDAKKSHPTVMLEPEPTMDQSLPMLVLEHLPTMDQSLPMLVLEPLPTMDQSLPMLVLEPLPTLMPF